MISDFITPTRRRLNAKYGDPRETHEATVGILLSLFPSWLPVAFAGEGGGGNG